MTDPLKEAFTKVRQDIDYLYSELEEIKQLLHELKFSVSLQPTNQQSIPTQRNNIPTQDLPQYSLISGNNQFSTGNEGVPTNQPTNHQTNQHTGNEGVQFNPNSSLFTKPPVSFTSSRLDHLSKVTEILQSLDELKKEVRIKFKQLTEQEMMIFSAIYQLENQGFTVDYSLLSNTLKLTEISIRDYVRKIISKGIPLIKHKQQNKKILLSISQDLKKVASLDTILQLREL